MSKLFCVSDIHGFYNELKVALDKSGFDETNNDHWLIVCGDCLDRGRQPQEVINYLISLDRCILIRGNHEDLLVDLLRYGSPAGYDWSNGTAYTVMDLAPNAKDWNEACTIVYGKVFDFVNRMIDYFETENYVFVHSSIPAICKDNFPKHYTRGRSFEYDPDWRNADKEAWDNARWGQPFDMVERGIVPEGKTLVFGHWHTSCMWAQDEGRSEFGEDAKFEPYFGNGFIGLDCCTAASGKVGVVVLEDNFLK